MQLGGQQPDDLDGADEERDGDGQAVMTRLGLGVR
jgi:hypothetical protein